MKQFSFRAGCLCALAVLAPIATSRGADTAEADPVRRADAPVIITATRSLLPAFSSPFSTDSIEEGELLDRNYRTLPEALLYTPGVLVQRTGPGQASPFIRGFTGFRTLFLVDGVRLNNSVFREGPNQYWSTVDSYSVERLELVKGPSSVLYGSDAIGGTVNAITKSPMNYTPGQNTVDSSICYRVSSAERSHTLHAEIDATFGETFGIHLGLTGKHYGDIQSGHGSGRLHDSGYDEWDADFKGEFFLNADTRLVFAYQRVQQNNVPRWHSTNHAESFEGTTTGSNDRQRDLDQDRELLYVKLHAENVQNAFFDTLRVGLSWHDQSEIEDRIVSNGSRRKAGFDVGNVGFFLHLESPSSIGRLAYGVEFYHDNVNSFERRSNEAGPRIQGPVADDSSYDLFGIYLQDTITVNDRLDLILGGRFNYASLRAGEVVDGEDNPVTGDVISVQDNWSAFVGSARAIYKIIPDQLNLFGGVSQGFRAPNLSDVTASRSAASGIFEVPALDLDPEYYVTFELGLKFRQNDFGASAAYYYTIISDMIIRSPTGETTGGIPDEQIVQGTNSGDGFVHGIELDAWYRFCNNFTLFGNATWMEGRVDTFLDINDPDSLDRRAITRQMPLTGLIGLRYDEPDRKWWVEGTLQLVDNANILSPSDQGDSERIPPGGHESYAVASIRAGIRLSKNLTVTAACENLTNEEYRVHGSGINQPGRNFILGVELKF